MHNKIKEEIENRSARLFGQKTISQHIYNDGNNSNNLKQEKALMLKELIKDHINLVDTKKHYPIDDIQDIDLGVDLIVIDKETFDNIFNG